LPKRLSDTQKEEIIKGFISGRNLDQLSKEFGFTKLTISRKLRENFGEDEYLYLLKKNKLVENSEKKYSESQQSSLDKNKNQILNEYPDQNHTNNSLEDNYLNQSSSFIEIVPLDLDINNDTRKELSSIPIDEVNFPKNVFMIVDKKIELEIKILKDYPEWHFLPEEDLKNKTIEIYSDLKDARRNCKKEQKVIKVPNPNVFKIASKMMLSKGISRIISDKQLIAL
tara:strand:- start:1042 stop:1719 length:678 start_codon:yes stop_codon:yes gene_type:complete